MMFDNPQESENDFFSKNLIETITLLCRNNMKHTTDLKIQGLIALTADSTDFMVIPINELITKNNNNYYYNNKNNNYHDNGTNNNQSMFQMMNNNHFPDQNLQRPSFIRNLAGRGRATPKVNNSVRMKLPNQFLTPNKKKVKQNLKFYTPQKKPTCSRPEVSPMANLKRTQQTDYMQDIENEPEIRPRSANNAPAQKRRLVQIKNEIVNDAMPNQNVTYNNFSTSNDVFVLSDEEGESRTVRIKNEPTAKTKRIPSNVNNANNNLDDIVQSSITACSRMPVQYVKEEPTISIETLKSESGETSYSHWSDNQSTSKVHHCQQCAEEFSNLRALRQHIRQVHTTANNESTIGKFLSNIGAADFTIGEIVSTITPEQSVE